jgi:hypothetical protein
VKEPVPVEMWFDPTCPHTWKTSRWLTCLAELGKVTITWHVMSLAILNEGKPAPPERAERRAQSVPVLRTLEAVREQFGNEAVGALFAAYGRKVHGQGAPVGGSTLDAALGEAGLPASLRDTGSRSDWQDKVQRSHDAGQERVGRQAGSPIVAVGAGRGFFGPVITSVPNEQDAVELLRAVGILSSVTEFAELQGSR